MRRLLAAIIICLLAGVVHPVAADRAERAAALLEQAEASLKAARSPKERLAALGRAAQAQEATLQALRTDLRFLVERQQVLEALMEADADKSRAVLAALLRIERAPRAAALAHPGGVVAAARAGRTLSTFAPDLAREAARIRTAIEKLSDVRTRRDTASTEARSSLAALQAARGEVADLIRRDRTTANLPAEVVARLRDEGDALARSAANLRALAAALPDIVDDSNTDSKTRPLSMRAARGALIVPVEGDKIAGFGDKQSGIALEGVQISAPSYAEIYAPWSGVIRFSGQYGTYGGVVILEPEPDILIVLAGLAAFYREAGEVILAGEPLGSLGGPPPQDKEFLITDESAIEATARETLYIEVRQGGVPEDPARWFAF